MESRLISRREAANILGVTAATISNFVERGVINAVKLHGRVWVDRANVEALLCSVEDIVQAKKEIEALSAKYEKVKDNIKSDIEKAEHGRNLIALFLHIAKGGGLEILEGLYCALSRGCKLTERQDFILRTLFISGSEDIIADTAQKFKVTNQAVKYMIRSIRRKIKEFTEWESMRNDRNSLMAENTLLKSELAHLQIRNAFLEKQDEERSSLIKQLRRADFTGDKNFLGTPLVDTELSVRARNVLIYAGCYCVLDVLKMSRSEISHLRNCGPKSVLEIKEWLNSHGLNFGMLKEQHT